MAAAEAPNWALLHRRFGHASAHHFTGLHRVVDGLTDPIEEKPNELSDEPCEPCIMSKQVRVLNRNSPRPVTTKLGRVYIDIWGPYSIATFGGATYFMTITDEATRKKWVFLGTRKTDFRASFMNWKARAELESGCKLQRIRMDNAGELVSMGLDLVGEGVVIETTTPYSPEQNGISERLNRTLVCMAKAMLFDAGLPAKLWGPAIETACFLRNRLPISK